MGTRRTSSPGRENIVAGATFGVLAAAALSAGAWSLSNLSDYHSAALVAESEQRAAEEAAERADQNPDPNDPDGLGPRRERRIQHLPRRSHRRPR